MNVKIELSVEEVNQTLAVLAKRPIYEVLGLFSKIKQTAEHQVVEQQKAAQVVVEDVKKSEPQLLNEAK